MIRKSGYRFSEKITLKEQEHDPEKWVPVFRKDPAQMSKSMIRKSGYRFSEKTLLKQESRISEQSE
jgi:hypothetical protein